MARIVWAPRAADDLIAACEHIARDSQHYAQLVAQKIVTTVESAGQFPESGSIVPEFDDPLLREKMAHNFRIIYRIREGSIEVVTILHGARQMPDLHQMNQTK